MEPTRVEMEWLERIKESRVTSAHRETIFVSEQTEGEII